MSFSLANFWGICFWRKYSPSLRVFQKMSCSPLFCCFTLVMVCLMGGAQADSEFQLKVEISPQDLSVISSAGQQVTLVRTSQIGGPTRWSTVWASFSPFPNNLITWNNTGLSFY